MPITPEHLQSLETIVADAVRAVRDDASQSGELRTFYAALKEAGDSLRGLTDGRNCDYDLPFMGEAYALWYHMRRVAQVYQAFDKFRGALTRLAWEDWPWKMLDVGAGTGAGSMALTRWVLDRIEPEHPGAIRRASVTCLEPAMPMVETGERIARLAAECMPPAVASEWRRGEVGGAPVLGDERYDLILFSTTFDYVADAEADLMQETVADFVEDHLTPSGGAVLILAPNAGSEQGKAGPKIRFARGLLGKLKARGFNPSREHDHAELQPGLQAGILAARREFYEDATRIDRKVALDRARPDTLPEREQPRYINDVYTYGRWIGGG